MSLKKLPTNNHYFQSDTFALLTKLYVYLDNLSVVIRLFPPEMTHSYKRMGVALKYFQSFIKSRTIIQQHRHHIGGSIGFIVESACFKC